jgi:ABC-2 type transport system permease protein
MTLIATERIKLFTTRSPWWSTLLALVLSIGFAALIAANIPHDQPFGINEAEGGYQFGLVVMMVMAALAVTTEYRFGTIKTTFQAVPNRTALLLAKTSVVAVLSAVIGEVASFASWALARAIHPTSTLALSGEAAWRNIAGMGLVYLVTAVIAVAVAILVRQTAGAVAILLIYTLLVENLVVLIPRIGRDIQQWMPFTVANQFLTGGETPIRGAGTDQMPLAPWPSLLYFAGIGAVLLIIAIVTANRRDA